MPPAPKQRGFSLPESLLALALAAAFLSTMASGLSAAMRANAAADAKARQQLLAYNAWQIMNSQSEQTARSRP